MWDTMWFLDLYQGQDEYNRYEQQHQIMEEHIDAACVVIPDRRDLLMKEDLAWLNGSRALWRTLAIVDVNVGRGEPAARDVGEGGAMDEACPNQVPDESGSDAGACSLSAVDDDSGCERWLVVRR